jgi:hypothetical protein
MDLEPVRELAVVVPVLNPTTCGNTKHLNHLR